MKPTLSLLLCCGLLMAGCREKDPFINFGVVQAVDSSYMGPVPATDPHNVLVEEFTGQDCPACPGWHTTLENISASSGKGRINVVSMYFHSNAAVTQPPPGARYDFRQQFVDDIQKNSVYVPVNPIPAAGIDRTLHHSAMVIEGGEWADAIEQQKQVSDSLNLAVESQYANGTATIKVTVTYTQPVAARNSISVYVVEDSMVDIHAIPFGFNNSYNFLDVFRAMLATSVTGDVFLDNVKVKQPGQVYWRKFTYQPDLSRLNPAHCRVIAFVSSPGTGGDYRVYQSVQCALKP